MGAAGWSENGCQDPAPGHPAEGGVYLAFQPLLGFYLDLGIGGRGDIGKEKKKQQCDKRKMERKTRVRHRRQKQEALIPRGKGPGRVATQRPRQGTQALKVALLAHSPCTSGPGPGSKGAGHEMASLSGL